MSTAELARAGYGTRALNSFPMHGDKAAKKLIAGKLAADYFFLIKRLLGIEIMELLDLHVTSLIYISLLVIYPV